MDREELEQHRRVVFGEALADFTTMARTAVALLAEVERLAAPARAQRDAALEEAATPLAGQGPHVMVNAQAEANRIRALKSSPARRFVDEARAVEVLAAVALDAGAGRVENTGLGVLLEIAHRLNLPRENVTPPALAVDSAACTSASSQVKT